MKLWIGFITVALFAGVALSQELPAGTAIPVSLSSSLNSNEKADKKIEGKVMQDVPLPSGRKVRKGSRVTGHIVASAQEASGARLVIKFDTIQNEKNKLPLNVALLALATVADIGNAQSPAGQNSDIFPKNQWVTRQVGGDTVDRAQGKVASREGLVGTWIEGSSVLAKLTPNPDAGCPTGPGYDRDQAVWVFSSGACGIYGLKNVKVVASGRLPPFGEITLASKDNIEIHGGSGWLLIVVETK